MSSEQRIDLVKCEEGKKMRTRLRVGAGRKVSKRLALSSLVRKSPAASRDRVKVAMEKTWDSTPRVDLG